MIARRGWIPMVAPASEEVPDVEPQAVASLLAQWRTDPFKIVICQTGGDTGALFQATDAAGLTGDLLHHLKSSVVVVRGPNPVGELNARQVRIDIRAVTPFTTEMVLAAMSELPVHAERVLVQRYGAANQLLREALEKRGAGVHEIATYRWALPADIQPLNRLLEALADAGGGAVGVTSAVQIYNLYAVAGKAGRGSGLANQLNRLGVAAIRTGCSRGLAENCVTPSVETD